MTCPWQVQRTKQHHTFCSCRLGRDMARRALLPWLRRLAAEATWHCANRWKTTMASRVCGMPAARSALDSDCSIPALETSGSQPWRSQWLPKLKIPDIILLYPFISFHSKPNPDKEAAYIWNFAAPATAPGATAAAGASQRHQPLGSLGAPWQETQVPRNQLSKMTFLRLLLTSCATIQDAAEILVVADVAGHGLQGFTLNLLACHPTYFFLHRCIWEAMKRTKQRQIQHSMRLHRHEATALS